MVGLYWERHCDHRGLLQFADGAVMASPDCPARLEKIVAGAGSAGIEFRSVVPALEGTSKEILSRVHSAPLCRAVESGARQARISGVWFPEVFPKHLCIDTYTSFVPATHQAAMEAFGLAIVGAELVLSGAESIVYVATRPAGHHAGKGSFGGYCYFNNAAGAAEVLARTGRVGILDIDLHHGNGTQEVFWNSDAVAFASVHGEPSWCYPFTGTPNEQGANEGEGFTKNLTLPVGASGRLYRQALSDAVSFLADLDCKALVVSLGFDTLDGDNEGIGFSLTEDDMRENAKLVTELGLPMLIVQEGGYLLERLEASSEAFFHVVAGG